MFTLLTSEESSLTLPWVEKYRPTKFEDMAGQRHILSTLMKFVDNNKLPHLLFYGPPGTGKTTAVLALARRLFGNSLESISSNVLELNASDDRGIDVVRDQIKSFASSRNIFHNSSAKFTTNMSIDSNNTLNSLKLVILDEADSMTNAAQDALRRVIEKYVKYVRFVLICNDISKITPAIQSRCTLFRFAPLDRNSMKSRLECVVREENLSVTEDGKQALVDISNGDMRKVLNTMQAAVSAYQEINEENVYRVICLPTPKMLRSILDGMFTLEFDAARHRLNSIKESYNFSLMDILRGIFELLIRLENIPKIQLIHLLEHLSIVESHLVAGGNESIHVSSLVGSFQVARQLSI